MEREEDQVGGRACVPAEDTGKRVGAKKEGNEGGLKVDEEAEVDQLSIKW